MSDKRKQDNRLAKRFIYELKKLTAGVINGMDANAYFAAAKSLKELFDSFAIIEEFVDPLECYWEIKIALKRYDRFVNKDFSFAADFKKLLDYFFDIIEQIYFYEIFGFLSTKVHPQEIYGVPVICYCGCAPSWPLEPVLDEHGKVVYKKVIRFQNNDKKRPLCMTISSNPLILEGRENCKLTDEQIGQIKNFVRKNQDIIKQHYKEKTDSIEFIDALKKRNNTWRNAQNCFKYPAEKPPVRLLKAETGLPVNIVNVVHSFSFELGLLEYIEIQTNTNDEIDDKNSEMILFTKNAETLFADSDVPSEILNPVQEYVKQSYSDKNSLLYKTMQKRKAEWDEAVKKEHKKRNITK